MVMVRGGTESADEHEVKSIRCYKIHDILNPGAAEIFKDLILESAVLKLYSVFQEHPESPPLFEELVNTEHCTQTIRTVMEPLIDMLGQTACKELSDDRVQTCTKIAQIVDRLFSIGDDPSPVS